MQVLTVRNNNTKSKYKVLIENTNQLKRFKKVLDNNKYLIYVYQEDFNGIHNINDFERIIGGLQWI